jgi:hypothetical protein
MDRGLSPPGTATIASGNAAQQKPPWVKEYSQNFFTNPVNTITSVLRTLQYNITDESVVNRSVFTNHYLDAAQRAPRTIGDYILEKQRLVQREQLLLRDKANKHRYPTNAAELNTQADELDIVIQRYQYLWDVWPKAEQDATLYQKERNEVCDALILDYTDRRDNSLTVLKKMPFSQKLNGELDNPTAGILGYDAARAGRYLEFLKTTFRVQAIR